MSSSCESVHVPVLAAELLALAEPRPGEVWVDCTVGGGGHTALIAQAVGPTGRVVGLDQDAAMLARAAARLAGKPVTLVHANFDQLPEVLAAQGLDRVHGLIADLGVASDQLDDPARGLSFLRDGPLDMRLNPAAGCTAADFINHADERSLAGMFWDFGEERHSRRIARRIVEQRQQQPFATTTELAEFIRRVVPRTADSRRIHPATRCFQALRIAVNDELAALDRLLAVLPNVLAAGGRTALISFHSLEDRRVKHALRDRMVWKLRTRKPVEAGADELTRNPRARSAKLRVAERL